MTTKPYLCLDFDGVIHSYTSRWKGVGVIPDAPVGGAGLFLLKALQVFRVGIYSSRSRYLRGRWAMKKYVQDLIHDAYEENLGEFVKTAAAVPHGWGSYKRDERVAEIVRAIEWPWFKPSAFITLDDRAVTFHGTFPDPASLATFKPWNKL